jgi:hypothetical protein
MYKVTCNAQGRVEIATTSSKDCGAQCNDGEGGCNNLSDGSSPCSGSGPGSPCRREAMTTDQDIESMICKGGMLTIQTYCPIMFCAGGSVGLPPVCNVSLSGAASCSNVGSCP